MMNFLRIQAFNYQLNFAWILHAEEKVTEVKNFSEGQEPWSNVAVAKN
jgi:hypothetical protein